MNVLGVAGGFGHDAAACVVRDGRVAAFSEEERHVREKRAPGKIPWMASAYCLHAAGLRASDIDVLAVSWDPRLDATQRQLWAFAAEIGGSTIWHGAGRVPEMVFVEHHLSHAASSYFASGFDEAAVLVVDGNGEAASTSLGYARGNELKLDVRLGVEASLGHFYKCVTEFLGFGAHGEGKTMGLASYARSASRYDVFELTPHGYKALLPHLERGSTENEFAHLRRRWRAWLERRFGPMRLDAPGWNVCSSRTAQADPLRSDSADIAAGAQHALEEVLAHVAALACRRCGSRKLVLSGGVALNCAANGKLARSGFLDDLYVFPAAHDAGGALGAALYVASSAGAIERNGNPYLGPAQARDHTLQELERFGLGYSLADDIGETTAQMLERGEVVGWFQGRAELGPRALCHRSILALASSAELRDRVNRIKGREPWRPLAPTLSVRAAGDLLNGPASPYMLLAALANDRARGAIPGAVHVDGTVRAQVVTPWSDARVVSLLHAVERRTGSAAVLNTSFNMEHEPIVSSVEDAVRTFFASGLDALVLGDIIVRKRS